jgi:toxin CcdB
MAKFDVYRLGGDGAYVLDCQADLLRDLNTRLVVPLLPLEEAPAPASRLNPIFEARGKRLVMMTQFAATVPVSELKTPLLSLDDQAIAIGNALDVLISGF